jgi:hypothetical protein
VTISTCGQTQVDTKIAIYHGCACPGGAAGDGGPLCCGDDECPPVPGRQTIIHCDVICGEQYMIQIGTKPGTPPGQGTFTVDCAGQPCLPPPVLGPCAVAAGECCAGRPRFNAPAYQAFGNLVVLSTAGPQAVGTAVVNAFNVVNPNGGPFNTDFGAPFYSHPSWSETNLGSVFGITLDRNGNVYVTDTSVYGSMNSNGTLGGIGDVYKLDTNTGAASVFATLPNTGPGLGNISYDCAHDQFFVSNMDDGMIYRLSATGTTLSTFDFGAPDAATSLFPPLGDRVWAVQAHNNRLYFSVWAEDLGRPSPLNANQIWSIALDGSGNFSGAPQLELLLPPNTGQIYSNPVADIRFTSSGSMLLAERGMSDDTSTWPHDSRLLEYVCSNLKWLPSGNTFGVGVVNNGTNSAGGVDIDYDTGGRVYGTGDALQLGPQIVYGTQGLPATGGTVANSVLIDFNGDLTAFDKTFMGDVAVPCPRHCMEVVPGAILCEVNSTGTGFTGCYNFTFDVTNNSGVTAQYMLFPNANITPNIIVLNPPLPSGQTRTVTIKICNVQPGDTFCYHAILADASVNECCSINTCVDIPDCTCFQLPSKTVACRGPNTFKVTFTLQNLTPDVVEHMFFFPPLPPDPNSNMTLTPSYFDVPTLPPFATTAPIVATVQFPVAPAPGTQVCIRVSIHNAMLLECCSKVLCFTIPQCGVECIGDCTFDGIVNIDDLLQVINHWGTCPAYCAADLAPAGGNGIVNIDDLLVVITHWGNRIGQQ